MKLTHAIRLLSILSACLSLTFVKAADAPPKPAARTATTPLDTLLELCSGTATLPVEKLKQAYLDLEWARLSGKTPPPKAEEESDNDKKKKSRKIKYSAPLTADEIAKFETWFKEQPKFREKFLLALNPYTDDMPAAARIALKLREKFPKESDTLSNLVIAFAVVWDSAQTVKSLSSEGIPELRKKQPEMVSFEDSFGWYVKHQKEMCPEFAETPWRLLKYLSGESMIFSEREWSLNKAKFSPTLGKIYSSIVYDMSKLEDKIGKLGNNPYTLENLSRYGGVCRDQAFYARTFCRAYGMPAYIAHGTSNAGGGHAWVGWIVKDPKGYQLMEHGRYSGQKFFTARLMSPDSGEHIYDYMVGIEAEALSNEKSYETSDLLYRIWTEAGSKLTPEIRNKLLIESLKQNVRHRMAWMALGEATASGELPRASAEGQWKYLNSNFQAYPDFIFGMLENCSRMAPNAQGRYAFYEVGVPLFKKAKREDLVTQLRMQELELLAEEKMETQAATVGEGGVIECAGEGAGWVKLATRTVELMRKLKQEPRAAEMLMKVLPKTPKTDTTNEPNPNYISTVTLLRDLYKDIGDTKNQAAMQAKLDALPKSRKS